MAAKRNRALFILFYFLPLFSFGQPVWREVKSDIVNCFSSHAIYSVKKDGNNNIYASVNQSVYRWNGFGWIQLGSTIPSSNGNGTALTISADAVGNVYAGGFFKDAAGFYYVAKWNGFTWSTVGAGLNANNPVLTTAVDGAGNIYAAGQFFNASGKRYVAKWNGSSWSELGGANALNAGNEINSIATDAAGNVYAAGQFFNSSGNSFVAKWNGSTWTEVGGLNALGANSRISVIHVVGPNEIYAGGQFTNASGKRYVAKWDGSTWTELGGLNALNANGFIRAISKSPGGIVYCGGDFTDGTGKTFVSRWNGTNWAKAGAESFSSTIGSATIYSIEIDGTGKIYCGGDFLNTYPSRHVVNLNVNNWELTGLPGTGMLTPPPFTNANIRAMITDYKNNLYAGGSLNGGGPSYYVAKWNDTIWQPLGQGANALNANGGISTMVRDRAGNIYAAGGFTNASGKPYVAKWNGVSWSEVGGANGLNANQSIHSIAVDFAGNVYATGEFTNGAGKHYIARWNGAAWAEIAVPNVPIMSNKTWLTTDSSGTIIAGIHDEHNLYSFLARWNGTAWVDIGVRNGAGSTGVGYETDVISIAIDKFNNIYAVAGFLGACQVRKWNGTAWSSLGPLDFFTSAFSLYADTTGKVYASGTHHNVVGGYRDDVFLWTGTEWTKVGAANPLNSLFYRTAMTIDNMGRIYSAGDSTTPFASGYGIVSVFDTLFPGTPVIKNVTDQCLGAPTAKGKLENPPKLPGTVKILLDGSPIAYNAVDSSFTYFINPSTSAGAHRVVAQYLYYIHTRQKDSIYNVSAPVTPAITISGITTVQTGQSTTISSTPANGGASPAYQWQDSTNAHTWQTITGATSTSINYTPPHTGAKLRCILQSNASCLTSSTATSNVLIFTVNIVTAVNPVAANRYGIKFFPNPVTERLYIDSLRVSDKWETLDVFDITGQKTIGNINIKGRTNIALGVQHLAAGQYVVMIRARSGKRVFLKFIKQ